MQKGCHTPFCLFIGALLLFGRRSAHFLSNAVLFQTRGPLLEFSFYISPLDIPSVTASLSLQQEVTPSSSSHSSPSLLLAVNFRSCAGRAVSGIRLTRAPSRAEQGAEVMGLKVKHHTAAGRPRSVCQSRLSSSSFPLRCAAACTSCARASLSSAGQHSWAEAGGLQNVDATKRRLRRLLNFMPMVRLMHALSQTRPVFGSALILSPGCGQYFFIYLFIFFRCTDWPVGRTLQFFRII